MPDHDRPHCAEARAMADELRKALPDIHSVRPLLKEARDLIVKLRTLLPVDGHHIDSEHEPHDAPSIPTTERFHNGG